MPPLCRYTLFSPMVPRLPCMRTAMGAAGGDSGLALRPGLLSTVCLEGEDPASAYAYLFAWSWRVAFSKPYLPVSISSVFKSRITPNDKDAPP